MSGLSRVVSAAPLSARKGRLDRRQPARGALQTPLAICQANLAQRMAACVFMGTAVARLAPGQAVAGPLRAGPAVVAASRA